MARLQRAPTQSISKLGAKVCFDIPKSSRALPKFTIDSLQYPETFGIAMTNTVNNPWWTEAILFGHANRGLFHSWTPQNLHSCNPAVVVTWPGPTATGCLQVTKILGSQANFDLTGFGDQLAHPNYPAGAI